MLARSGFDVVRLEREAGRMITEGVPVWAFQVLLPLGFVVLAWRIVRTSYKTHVAAGVAALIGALLGIYLGAGLPFNWTDPFSAVIEQGAQSGLPGGPESYAWWLVALLAGAVAGAPIFALLGGAAAIMFLSENVPPSAILIQTYQLSTKPTLASIPLFTLVGCVARRRRGAAAAAPRLPRARRLVPGRHRGRVRHAVRLLHRVHRRIRGHDPGARRLAVPGALVKDGYRERFSLGLLTASGSLGLLLPPALPLILYGIVAQIADRGSVHRRHPAGPAAGRD